MVEDDTLGLREVASADHDAGRDTDCHVRCDTDCTARCDTGERAEERP